MDVLGMLGYKAADRLLIVNADDFGMCHATNEAIKQLLDEGAVSSATVMMPCGWAKDAAVWSAAHPQADVGIHLTFTSEWEGYKWGPVNRQGGTSSLVTAEGYFPSDCLTFERQAEPAQVRAEMIAQIEMALSLGMNPTHLDSHMGSLYGLETGRDFLDIVFDVCSEYGLPFRLPKSIAITGMQLSPDMEALAQQRAAQAAAKGVVILDELLSLPYANQEGQNEEQVKAEMAALLRSLKPGVSEIIIHPSCITTELQSITPHWERRGLEFQLLLDPGMKQVIADEGIHLIRWADLRDAQRGMPPQRH
ncbi:polysaccharide deacetylase family protein [Paenibacillus apiarius]|uniref:Polysaccharide deacetylase family protein n=1 Tax=Paenibacillus apiarius TaxID=46240 RepID=A0ABT4DUB3_9BACL|nr:polysaccharide deacetylase family protein [Paenibacillus apiarius]MCY9514516.1 polysaccharide deacetylase family protein [Paenibacillus apiarius]MCY9520945.1 polysaccharide deacetylase family protein [Paenibacillus apiarius]MCY9551793.1 polysaccharide deacetylase family protein [Paenibacillus apiarius]MCY9557680.1 polysaccharide deacetylase family protein [Paenibacillus apiarius]MCY9684367.1 polysaccharide deacetylase family protein [Paenibacillus apiarius]